LGDGWNKEWLEGQRFTLSDDSRECHQQLNIPRFRSLSCLHVMQCSCRQGHTPDFSHEKVTDVRFKSVACNNEVCISVIDMYWCVLLIRRLVLKEKKNKEMDKYSLSRRKHIELHDTKRYHEF
jgi:hypothetical protein